MEGLLNEVKCSSASLRPQCKLNPSKLLTAEINVNSVTVSLEKSKGFRKLEKEIRSFDEVETETAAFRNDARTLFDKIQHSIDMVSKFRRNENINVTHVTDDVFRVQMSIDSRPVYFQVRCDVESNRFLGVRSEPPVDSIEKIEKLQDLEEIISMMTAAFKQYFRESTTK